MVWQPCLHPVTSRLASALLSVWGSGISVAAVLTQALGSRPDLDSTGRQAPLMPRPDSLLWGFPGGGTMGMRPVSLIGPCAPGRCHAVPFPESKSHLSKTTGCKSSGSHQPRGWP